VIALVERETVESRGKGGRQSGQGDDQDDKDEEHAKVYRWLRSIAMDRRSWDGQCVSDRLMEHG
jgi:hypothetical protein